LPKKIIFLFSILSEIKSIINNYVSEEYGWNALNFDSISPIIIQTLEACSQLILEKVHRVPPE